MANLSTPPRTAFFYGTLMAPQVLQRVCHGPKSTQPQPPIFHPRPALLLNHRRHRVRNADYPAILPHANSSVRGTCVSGLSDADIWRLDIFEGDEYRREKVSVHILTSNDDAATTEAGDEVVEAETYIWSAPASALEDQEWDFEEFRREKMRFWVGAEGAGEYAEVDDAVAAADDEQQRQRQGRDGTGGRGVNGHITSALEREQRKDDVLQNAV